MITRRQFLTTAAAALPSAHLAISAQASDQKTPSDTAGNVVVARNPKVIASGRAVHSSILATMLDSSMKMLTGETNAASAWKSLFSPSDVIGIKVSCLAGMNLSSHPDLARLIAESLMSAGVPGRNIYIWERTNKELERAGFTIARDGSGPRCLGTDDVSVGYDDTPRESGRVGSCFSRFLSTICTAMISVPILKDHDLAGVSLSMKNFYGGIHNPNKYHEDNCDPYVADLCAHPFIKGKLRLAICDAMTAQYQGGPSFKEQYVWSPGAILVGRDPVALDRVGADMIEKKRAEAGLPSLKDAKRDFRYIQSAAALGLGVADLQTIKIMNLDS